MGVLAANKKYSGAGEARSPMLEEWPEILFEAEPSLAPPRGATRGDMTVLIE